MAVGLQQFFDRQPVYTEVNARDDVLLQCHVINKKGQCVWQKDRRVSIFINIFFLFETVL